MERQRPESFSIAWWREETPFELEKRWRSRTKIPGQLMGGERVKVELEYHPARYYSKSILDPTPGQVVIEAGTNANTRMLSVDAEDPWLRSKRPDPRTRARTDSGVCTTTSTGSFQGSHIIDSPLPLTHPLPGLEPTRTLVLGTGHSDC